MGRPGDAEGKLLKAGLLNSGRAVRGGVSRGVSANNVSIVAAAARRYRVPLWVLVGVKLQETGRDSGIEPNGKGRLNAEGSGAAGPFQFIPSTAAQYHVNVNDFASSAYGASHYLSDLHRQLGSWDAALRAYSGGGYGEAQIRSQAATVGIGPTTRDVSWLGEAWGTVKGLFAPKWPGGQGSPGSIQGGKEGIEGAAKAISGPFGALEHFFEILTSGETWLRIGETLAGAILIYLGLKALTGVGAADLPGVRTAKTAATVAIFK